jgi:hypothetical protein
MATAIGLAILMGLVLFVLLVWVCEAMTNG